MHELFVAERGIGPVEVQWDGRLANGKIALPGTYIWALRVQSDAFAEVHTGTVGVAH